jgi:hypothetical protein
MVFDEPEVIPSFLGVRSVSSSRERFDGGALNNYLLRIGEVQDVVYPVDPRSHSKKFIEYNVLCEHRENNIKVTRMYTGCVLINPFGGLADYVFWTLRPQDGVAGTASNLASIAGGLSTGSKVLILCVNGETFSPVIIGGVRQPLDSDMSVLPNTSLLRGRFNGFQWQIDDLGQMSLTYGGATDSRGAARPPNPGPTVTGTTLQFAVDGSWSVRSGSSDQSILLDNTIKKIDVNAFAQFNVNMSAGGLVSVSTPTGPVSVSCQTATVGATQGVSISGGTGGVTLGAGTDALMLGTRYRAAETALNQGVAAALQLLAATATQIAAGPPPLAGQALAVAVAAAATAISAAILAFEGGAQSYLSPLNRTD